MSQQALIEQLQEQLAFHKQVTEALKMAMPMIALKSDKAIHPMLGELYKMASLALIYDQEILNQEDDNA